ncbi:MAG: CehA/McbA family metallohydrolase [Planctomycetes bacterium]|nr:CehA/McbA family metallohydrolase [Planctomycetota bacterium]
MRNQVLMVASLVALATGCAHDGARWYKGNTHAHTVLCGHADSTPVEVATWYLDRGYNFLILSEHNKFIDPASVKLPGNRRDDFILIPGEEISGPKTIHTTGMNLDELVDWSFDSEHTSEIIQHHTDGAIAAGGVAILNHPNFRWAVTADDMLPVQRLHLFELFNGHPLVNNQGDEEHISTEELWDVLLTQGMAIYGVSSDDVHSLKRWGRDVSNPGRGWVMVRAETLTPDAITSAMQRGRFYATSGVILETVTVTVPRRGYSQGYYDVAVDEAATARELKSDLILGRRVKHAVEGFRIQWIGPRGEVVSDMYATRSIRQIDPGVAYLRCRVTYARKVDGGYEEFYAWTQPVFTDGRLDTFSAAVQVAHARDHAGGHTHAVGP